MSQWAESGPDQQAAPDVEAGWSAELVPQAGPGVTPSGPPHTGDQLVDEALESLAVLAGKPVQEQVEVYVGVHRQLQDRLADLDG